MVIALIWAYRRSNYAKHTIPTFDGCRSFRQLNREHSPKGRLGDKLAMGWSVSAVHGVDIQEYVRGAG